MIKINDKTISSIYSGEKVIEKVFKGTLQVYEGWKNLIASGVLPLTLTKCKGVDLIDYKIYGNSIQKGEPTPEAPVEIESVGEKTNNLINIHIISNDYCTTVNDTVEVKIIAGNSSSGCGKKLKELCPDLEVGKTYTLLFNVNSSNLSAISLGSFGVNANRWESGISRTITAEDLEANVRFGEYGSGSRTVVFSNIQVVEKGAVTDYEPYGKYKIPVKVSGKNLFDITKFGDTTKKYIEYLEDGNGFILLGTRFENGFACGLLKNFCPDLKVGDTFIFDFETDAFRNGITVNYIYLNVLASTLKIKKSYVCTQEMLDSNVYFYSGVTEDAYVKNFQLEKGGTSTPYEPYVEPITTNIYLDEPLRKVGDYADYIDFKKQKVFRKVGLQATNFTYHGYVSGKYLYIKSSIYKDMLGNSLSCISNKIKTFISFPASADNNRLQVNNQTFYYLVQAEESETQYYIDLMAGTEICYPLATPIEEEIKLPNIPTHKGTTIIETDTNINPSNMEVIYKGKK